MAYIKLPITKKEIETLRLMIELKIQQRNISIPEFADEIGINRVTIYQFLAGAYIQKKTYKKLLEWNFLQQTTIV